MRTSKVKEISHEGRLLTLLNQREHGARRGMIVSGDWTTGKTTALKQLGRTHELRVRQRYPGSDRIPVVYITAPPKGSPRKLAMEFARFLGLPMISPRHNSIDVTSAVCQVLIEARTDLLVDEIHLLNHATIAGEDLSDHAVIAACYERCSTFWHSLFQRGYRLSDRAKRLRRMSPNDRQVRPWQPQRYAAVYPEIVEAMSLYASSHWRSLALGEEEQTTHKHRQSHPCENHWCPACSADGLTSYREAAA